MKTGSKTELRKSLQKLDTYKFKLFFTIVASYWVKYKFFISDQNFFNLWCELNELCHEVDENFPDRYDDRDIIMDFCQQHPYYFIEILCPDMVQDLFCEHLDDRLGILITIAQKLHTEDLGATFEYINKSLGLTDDIDELIKDTLRFVREYSVVK